MRGHVQVIPASINKELGILARMKEAADLFKGRRVNRAEDFIYLFIYKMVYGESKNKYLKQKMPINFCGGGGKKHTQTEI